MNSFNHCAYGAVNDWLYQVVAGVELDPRHPAYKHFYLQPKPGKTLSAAHANHLSPHGEIVSGWKISPNRFEWEVVVPPSTTASARFPVPADANVTEGDLALSSAAGVANVRRDNGALTCELASGRYQFRAIWP